MLGYYIPRVKIWIQIKSLLFTKSATSRCIRKVAKLASLVDVVSLLACNWQC